MPQDAPMAKVEPTQSYGARGASSSARASRTRWPRRSRTRERRGATFVHPFEDEQVIAGQGTIGLELAEQVPEASARSSIPVGGGGLVVGDLARAAGGQAGPADRRRPGRDSAAGRSPTGSPSSSRRADRRRSSTRPLDEIVDGQRRGDQRGDRAAARAREARRRGRRGGRRGGAPRRQGRRRRARSCAVLSGGNIDPTAADLGDAPRADVGRPLPRRCARVSPTGPAS